jgi:phage shock protein PspC (stress-responsive transcriptional regulator)
MRRAAAEGRLNGMDTTTVNPTQPTDYNNTDSETPAGPATSRPLTRPVHDRMLTGTASGIARYLNVDVTLVRIAFAVLTVMGGVGVPLYVAGLLLIPEDGSDESIASSLLGSFNPKDNAS